MGCVSGEGVSRCLTPYTLLGVVNLRVEVALLQKTSQRRQHALSTLMAVGKWLIQNCIGFGSRTTWGGEEVPPSSPFRPLSCWTASLEMETSSVMGYVYRKYTTVRWKYGVPTEGKIKIKYIYSNRESIKQNIESKCEFRYVWWKLCGDSGLQTCLRSD